MGGEDCKLEAFVAAIGGWERHKERCEVCRSRALRLYAGCYPRPCTEGDRLYQAALRARNAMEQGTITYA